MDRKNSEICGSNGRRIQLRAARGSKKAKPRRNSFTIKKREAFLGHFAATANAKASARAAGVSHSTVFDWRKKNAQFRDAWYEALDQGYARVEAELVRYSAEQLAVKADGRAAGAGKDFDPKVALAVLEAYRRNRGARPGDVLPRRSDIEQVKSRLIKKMRALGLIPGGDRAGGEEGPSTASRSPSPGKPGEGKRAAGPLHHPRSRGGGPPSSALQCSPVPRTGCASRPRPGEDV